jgi:hypothetical protein
LAGGEVACPLQDILVGHAEGKVSGEDIAAFMQRFRVIERQIKVG